VENYAQNLWKTREKFCQMDPLAVSGLGCSIDRGADACCHDPSTTVGPVESFGTQKARMTSHKIMVKRDGKASGLKPRATGMGQTS
jgi:hypothetical protein